MYILTRKNRVIAYCDEAYYYVGSTVVCPKTGDAYQDAMIVVTDIPLPGDIDCRDYDYINGQFVRCTEEIKCTLRNTTRILRTTDWSAEKILTLTDVSGVTDINVVIISPDPEAQKDYTECGILCTEQSLNQLVFSCEQNPTKDILVNIVVLDNR